MRQQKNRQSRANADLPPRPGRILEPQWVRFIPVLLVLALVLTLGRSCFHRFVWWDDPDLLFHNPHYNPPTVASIAQYWTHADLGLYVPVVYTFWGLLAAVARLPGPDADGQTLNPAVFHFASLLIHCATVCVVYAILKRITRRPWAAMSGSLLFGLHPLQVESVAWIAATKSLLGSCLALIGVWQYFVWASQRGEDSESTIRPERPLRLAAATGAMVLGTLCSPLVVTAPLLAGILDLTFLRRRVAAIVVSVSMMLATIAPVALVARFAQPASTVPAVSWFARPLIAADALAFYLYKLVLPIHLGADYGRRPAVVLAGGWGHLSWIAPMALLAITIILRKRSPWLLGALAIGVAALLPVLGLTAFDFQLFSTVADRYAYLALLAPAIVIAKYLELPRSAPVWICCYVLLGCLAVRSALQSGYWRDDTTLWQHAVQVNPTSYVGHGNLGAAYSRLGATGQDAAIAEYRLAVAANPDYLMGNDNLASALLRNGHVEEAIVPMLATIRLQERLPMSSRGNLVEARSALGTLYLQRGEYTLAATMFEAALSARPDYLPAVQGLEFARKRGKTGTQATTTRTK